MRIVMIGAGNAATVLGRCMTKSGHQVKQIFNRTRKHAQSLADEMDASFTTESSSILTDADLYVVAIADHALPQIGTWLSLQNRMVVHTAGSISIRILDPVSKNYGVLYPVQTLNKEMKDVPHIPFLVDGNTVEDRTLLFDFAKTLSNEVIVADDMQRSYMHVAAVIVNNFTNHLYNLAQQFCTQHQLEFKTLLPLIEQTTSRLKVADAKDLQTGPAIRKDQLTIDKHLQLLNDHPHLQQLYKTLTTNIQTNM